MILKKVLLFLFGVTLASGQLMQKLKSAPYQIAIMPNLRSNGCPPASKLAPLICKLMQQNIDLHFKPQLIEPSTYIPPLVVENCDTPQFPMELELPAPVADKKPLVIPKPPALPSITIPKFPVPVIIEKPNPPSVPAIEPCEPAFSPEMPLVSIPVVPELPTREFLEFPQTVELPEPCLTKVVEPEIDFKPMVVPQPPELPPFVMPELPVTPVKMSELPMSVVACAEDQPINVVAIPEYIQPLAPIPAAPELPPARLPEIPVPVEIPSPPMIIERHLEEPCITEEIMIPQHELVLVPRPQKVPEVVIPEPVTVAINKPALMPIFPAFPQSAVVAEPCEPFPQPILKMAEFPPYFVPHLHSHVSVSNEKIKQTSKILIPAQYMDSGYFPAHGAYNLVREYVLPNEMANRLKLK